MSDSAPENVDLDEAFNSINPELLQAVLVKNLTYAVSCMCRDISLLVLPSAVLNTEISKDTVVKMMRKVADIKDLNDLITKVVPIHDEGMSKEQVETVKESINRHPILVEAAFRMSENIEDKLARKDV